jgi:hypothetical protein
MLHVIATFPTQQAAEAAAIKHYGASVAAQVVRSGARWRVRIEDRANWQFGWLGTAGECVSKDMETVESDVDTSE